MAEMQRVALQRPAAAMLSASRETQRVARRVEQKPREHALQRMQATRALQPALTVGPANDPFEREAERTADSVMNTSGRTQGEPSRGSIAASLMRVVQRALGKGEASTRKDDDERKRVQKAPATASRDAEIVPTGIESAIGRMSSGGQALSEPTRNFFEPRFGYDFSQVRTHHDGEAAGAAAALGARAFTVGNHIFFGAGEYRPDNSSGQRLIAHELTHTIQQEPAAARSARLLPASPRVQRDWFPDPRAAALNQLREWANELPPYELLTVVLARDPITDKPVERNARTSIHAALKLVPDGMAIYDDMEKNKTIEKTSQWFDAELAKLNLSWDGIKALFHQAWDAIDVKDLLSPRSAWEKVKAVFGPTLRRVADFAIAVGGRILDAIKNAVLGKLGAWAKEQRGYTLLTFVLGKDPVTDEAVQRTPKTFIKAVLDLIPGGDKVFENLEKARTIEKTAAWLDDQITRLDLTWEKIKALFRKAWDAFKVPDLLNPLGLIARIAEIFLPPARRVISFAIAVGKKVLEFIFEGAMIIAGPIGLQIVGIVRKIGDTFNKIVDDPVGFVGNLVQAVKLGFQQFGKNIWDHLKTGLIEWLVGTLEGAGLVLPKVWDLKGILSLVLQILGISYAKMRVKLVKVIGEERVAMLERVFGFIKTLVTEGPAAAWQQIVEAIGSLWDMVIGGIKDWAVTKIVTAALTKLVTMFNPAGAVIQAIIATYNTVAFFIERIKQILALVEAIVDSIANIASGKLSQAANFVERAMARTIPVILGFLARLIGLGDVSGAVKKVITAIQDKVDKGIDAVIKWIVDKAKSLFGGKDAKPDGKEGGDVDLPKAEFPEDDTTHVISFRQEGSSNVAIVSSTPTPIDKFIAHAKESEGISDDAKAKHIPVCEAAAAKMKALAAELAKKSTVDKDTKRQQLAEAEVALASALKALLAGVDIKKFDERYGLEGLVATYGSMPRQKNDRLTPDHQPQAALLKYAASVSYKGKAIFAGTRINQVVTGHATGAVAINAHEDRHKKGLTYARSVPSGVLANIDAAAKGDASPEKKQAKIIGIIDERKNKDVDAMIAVANVLGNYEDIEKWVGSKKKAAPLIAKIQTQIVAGEERVRNQNLSNLSSPA